MEDNKIITEEIVLSYLLHKPELLIDEKFPIKPTDFGSKINKLIYNATYNLYLIGASRLTSSEIKVQISKVPSSRKYFEENNGSHVLNMIENMEYEKYTFEVYYKQLKKMSLLRDLKLKGIDVADLIGNDVSASDTEGRMEIIDKMSYKDIIDHYKEKIAEVEDGYVSLIEKSGISAGENIFEVLHSFEEQEEIGLPLQGNIFNTAARGARKKKVYINSASSGQGKSRLAAGNAAKLAFPFYYDNEKEAWIETGLNNKVLFITTELEHNEIQSMLLSFISGVNEEKILTNRFDNAEEKERALKAAEIIQNNDNLYIEFVPDPSIESVAAKIRLYALQKEVEYVFYDYVHVSASTYKGKKDMRDDVWLMLFVDKLKQLANELNIFVMTATQVNASAYGDSEIKNESMIRGAKSVADKADIAFISTSILKEQEKGLAENLASKMGTKTPNQIVDLYKNRRGKWRNIRIWRYVDLGTCRVEDCFATDTGNNPIDIKFTIIQAKHLVKEGAFPIMDSDTGKIIEENRRESEISDF